MVTGYQLFCNTMSASVCFIYLFLAIIRSSSYALGTFETDSKLCFPKKFMFGVATAAYQIEGAWNVSGKGESIWDRYTHAHPERIFDHKTGDVAADSYHNFPRDAELMSQLGVQFYRFSISWPRILPNGLTNEVNEDGIRYYNDLLEELNRNGIMPIVTMYHWDLPQSLQDLGGWTNPIIIDYFVDYARVLFEAFGDKVKIWITVNEPLSFCEDGYGGNDAPGSRSSGFEDYLCGHNALIAHGRVYRMYQEEYLKKQKGFVGITIDFRWIEPASTSDDDQRAAEVIRQFTFGWFAHPIFSQTGDYPPIMRKRIDIISKRQNFHRSRLPVFTPEEVEIIRGSADFLGLNHYTTSLAVYSETKITPQPSFYTDMGGILKEKPEWPKSNSTWLKVVPWGFRKALNWIKLSYNNPLVLVTENGMSLEPGLQDTRRVNYIDGYLKALHTAIVKDKCNVIGYTYWSLIDNFEWTRGFSERFGLYEVDYDSPNKTRTARLSAAYYGKMARTKCIPSSWYFVD